MKSYLLPILVSLIIITSFCKAQNPALWGMTKSGGTGYGTLFNYNSTTAAEADIYNFSSDNYGDEPDASLIRATNGLFYGLTPNGVSPYNYGVIFSYDITTCTETDLHDFGSGTDGAIPDGSLLQASNGLLYGTTQNGGTYGYGTIFSYTISIGTETVLYNFNSVTGGNSPDGSLIEASNGLLYGMTTEGGATGGGVIFSYDITTSTYTDIYDFGNGSNGKVPQGSLIEASNGLLYGMTQYGGADYDGTIFSYNINTGKETDLHDFGSGTDGQLPYASLIQASNGLLYGMTPEGGSNGGGIIFSYDLLNGSYTDILDFGNGTDGYYPYGSLIQASDGLLYGMTFEGGSSGTIFNYNIYTGTETDIYDFTGSDGGSPRGDLIEYDPVDVTPLSQSICEGNSLTLTASGATTYTWGPETGLNAIVGDSVTANPTVTTIYSVTGTGSCGWTATVTDTVKVKPAPGLDIGPQTPSICTGQNVTLAINGSSSNFGFAWSPSTGLSSTTGDSTIASPNATTTYTVACIYSNGCPGIGTDIVTIVPFPTKPTITTEGNVLTSSATQDNQWYRNDTLLNGATNQKYTATIEGCYSVSTQNYIGCSTMSDTTCLTPTGVNQLAALTNQVSIFPNPSSGQFSIKLQDNQNDYSIEVYNIVGEKIYQSDLSNSQSSINIDNQPAGMYIVYLKSEEGLEVGKVLITK